MIGSTLAHYRILDFLGRGGMGSVYRARDTRLERDVALKMLVAGRLDDPVSRARLLREARTASQLNHPHICTIHEVSEAEGVLYIAMELIHGPTLRALIPPGGLPTESVLRYGSHIAEALVHAHAHGVIHRDLKSINVMVADGDRAKVLDFGIACTVEGSEAASVQSTMTLSEPGMLLGTPQMMAPESLRGEKGDARSDLWSLGVMLYEMTSGCLPFSGATQAELFAAILTRSPDPMAPDRPPRLCALIERSLAKDPALRPQAATEVHAELETLRNSPAIAAKPGLRLTGNRILDVVLVLVAVIGIGLATIRPRPPTVALAVLPLDNFSADPSQTYFADGVTEELIGNLGQIANLRVISRNSVMRYRGSTRPLGEIARELGVGLLVTGSVRPGQDSVRINAHLYRASPETELWSAGYTRSASQILSLQNEVAQEIARRISVRITPVEHSRLARSAAVRPEAYDEYLKGRSFWNQRTPQAMQQAIARYQHAITLDPDFPLAHAGLADAYARLSLYGNRPPRETYPAARAAATAALRLDESLAEAHVSLAAVALFYDRDWPGARVEFLRAIELRPSYATAHHWYSIWLRDRGQFPAALAEAQRALSLDPHSPILRVNLADTHYYARDFDAAIALHRQFIASDSAFAPAYLYLGMAYAQAHRPALAVAAEERAWALNGRGAYALGALGYVQARAGNAAAARRALAQLDSLSAQGFAVASDIALIHVGLGEKEEALRWLVRADDERGPLNGLAVDPCFDPLRDMAGFRALLVRLGLPG